MLSRKRGHTPPKGKPETHQLNIAFWEEIAVSSQEGKYVSHENSPYHFSGWWFQPVWKILVKLEIFPNLGWK